MIQKERIAGEHIHGDRLALAGAEAENQMAFYLRREFADRKDVMIFNDLRMVDANKEAAQIDHLILHRNGVILIESKSVAGTIYINQNSEFSRSFIGQLGGFPSPIQQVKRQAGFLIKRLKEAGMIGVEEGRKGALDWAGVVAISDHAVIEREIETPDVMKADQVVDRVVGLMNLARLAGDPQTSILSDAEMAALAAFLVSSHVPLNKPGESREKTGLAIYGMDEVVDETVKEIAERSRNSQTLLKTGMEEIDKKLTSLRPGGLYVLAARPGIGKTSLALRVVRGLVSDPDSPKRVLFISLEARRNDLAKKLIAAVGHFAFDDLDRGILPEHENERLEETTRAIRDWPMEFVDQTDVTVHHLRPLIRRRMEDLGGGIRLVVIDYLQLLLGSSRDQDEYARISEITRVLKTVAMELKIPVLALSQLSRDSEKGTVPREPRLSDLRGSGSIEQDADAVLFIHRLDSEEREGPDAYRTIKVIIAKNRFGPTGQTMMRFFPAKMSFEQVAHEEDEDGEGYGRIAVAHSSRGERLKQRPGAAEDLFSDEAPTP